MAQVILVLIVGAIGGYVWRTIVKLKQEVYETKRTLYLREVSIKIMKHAAQENEVLHAQLKRISEASTLEELNRLYRDAIGHP